jgi:hypothetical protein
MEQRRTRTARMRVRREVGSRHLVIGVAALMVAGLAVPASAAHRDRPSTQNLHPMGHIEEPRSLFGGADGTLDTNIHTDLAFWGNFAFQGNWDGFTIRDIRAPGNPKTVSHTSCDGNQGDVLVWGDILVRSWNTPAGTPGAFGAGLECAGMPVEAGFEGVHVFDISDLSAPRLVAGVATDCGSHTATAVPDPANDRLLVYNSSSSAACPGIDVIEVPLSDPAAASYLAFVPTGRQCHDTSVILGDAMLAACAGGDGFTMLDLSGSLTAPTTLYSVSIPGVTIGHSTAFSWDGEVVVFGHEPGGGVQARCQETSTDLDRTMFFYDAREGLELGRFVFERFQGPTENCTLHNFNVVPLRSGRDILVHGSYQAGTGVIDFTDPANPVEIAWSDQLPIPVPPTSPFGMEVGGAWSSYWYNGFIYESSITEGLNVFRFSGREMAGAVRLTHLNPQTQDFTLP